MTPCFERNVSVVKDPSSGSSSDSPSLYLEESLVLQQSEANIKDALRQSKRDPSAPARHPRLCSLSSACGSPPAHPRKLQACLLSPSPCRASFPLSGFFCFCFLASCCRAVSGLTVGAAASGAALRCSFSGPTQQVRAGKRTTFEASN